LGLSGNFISADDHIVEARDTWTRRMAKSKWGDRIPRVETGRDGADHWIVDGKSLPLAGRGSVAACLPDRTAEVQRWENLPGATYTPAERLKAMDSDGVACSVLYPMIAGVAGESFGAIADAELALACVQAYNDYVIEEWASASNRFIPQCIVPLASTQTIVSEIHRAVAKGHRGVIFPPFRRWSAPTCPLLMIRVTAMCGARVRNSVSRCAFMPVPRINLECRRTPGTIPH